MFGKWRHFQISLSLWKMQVIRYFLCVRNIGEKSLSRLLGCFYLKKQPPEVFSFKKGAFKGFANVTGKHLCWSLFLIKFQAWGPTTFSKRDTNPGVFPVNFAKHLRKKYLWAYASLSSQVIFTMHEKDTGNAA